MKGLELSYNYYKEFGEPMLKEQFPQLMPLIACGLCGSGSECLGFDDEVSRDHDMEPGFCIFLPGEDTVDRRSAFLLQRAYDKLPKEYEGLKKSLISPAGGSRRGVIRIEDFVRARTGSLDGELSPEQWYRLPEQYLLEVTNGRIFYDGPGIIGGAREKLSALPDDIRLRKLADCLSEMAQSGQYNYPRCLAHGEKEAARLALNSFVDSGLHAGFLLMGRYMPFYKWRFKALREEGMADYAGILSAILEAGPGEGGDTDETLLLIEQAASFVIGALQLQGLSDAFCGELEKHGRSVEDHISDPFIRNMK
ncbi:MAG: DUF4037 domain-containing protein [Firmicutes bacterium]|nr:DUF4037 domain-containing protein [Bacillota bacterium]